MAAKHKKKPNLMQKALAEFVATFFVTLTATSVDVLYYHGGHVDYVSRWLARACIAAAMIYAFSEVSGAHADPAVTLAFVLHRALSVTIGVVYVFVQMAGGFAAALLAAGLWGPLVKAGASHPGPAYGGGVALIAEILLTFLLVIVVLATAEQQAVIKKESALAVGLAIGACGFFGGPVSGASMNPARSIGPQIVGGEFGIVWIYALGPCVGAALAVLVATLIFGPPDEGERKAAQG